jgi:hypothetical protein
MLFDRIAGTEEPKIGIWPIMTDFTRVLDGGFTLTELATKYELTEQEQADAAIYLQHLSSMVQNRATALVASGISADLATEIARSVVDAKFRHGLLRAEVGTINEADFKTSLGM